MPRQEPKLPDNDPQVLKANVLARKEATAALELLGQQPPLVYELLIELCQEKLAELQPQTTPPPQSEDYERRLRRVERMIFPRGMHAGETVAQASTSYISWWTSPDEFTKELLWYTTTRRFRDRQETEEPDRDEQYDPERDETS